DDDAIGEPHAETIEGADPALGHERQIAVAIRIRRGRIDERAAVDPAPEPDLACDVLAAVLVIDVRVRPRERGVEARPPRRHEANDGETVLAAAELQYTDAVDDLTVGLSFVPGEQRDLVTARRKPARQHRGLLLDAANVPAAVAGHRAVREVSHDGDA